MFSKSFIACGAGLFLAATPVFAEDRATAFLTLFENYCLSRIGEEGPGHLPPEAQAKTTTFTLNGKSITQTRHILRGPELSLDQKATACAVTTEKPLSDAAASKLAAKLGEKIESRLPSLRPYEQDKLGWKLHRSWLDGIPSTTAINWGVILIHPGTGDPGTDFTSVTLILPPADRAGS